MRRAHRSCWSSLGDCGVSRRKLPWSARSRLSLEAQVRPPAAAAAVSAAESSSGSAGARSVAPSSSAPFSFLLAAYLPCLLRHRQGGQAPAATASFCREHRRCLCCCSTCEAVRAPWCPTRRPRLRLLLLPLAVVAAGRGLAPRGKPSLLLLVPARVRRTYLAAAMAAAIEAGCGRS